MIKLSLSLSLSIYLPQNAVASTKAFTAQVTCMALIAVWFSQIQETSDEMKRKVRSSR